MRKQLTLLAIVALFAGSAIADDSPGGPSAQLTRGLRMKLVAPKPQSEDPLGDITDQMTDIVGDLAALKTDDPVQGKQKQVVAQLDDIIKQLEEACKKSGAGGSRNPTRPMRDSVIAGGPGGMGDLIDPKSGTRNINNLPPKVRDQIMQSKTEGFPTGYESLLQSYYQRLAQEKVTPDDSNPKK